MGTETELEVLTMRRDSPTVVVTLLNAWEITVEVEELPGHAGAACATAAASSTASNRLDPGIKRMVTASWRAVVCVSRVLFYCSFDRRGIL